VYPITALLISTTLYLSDVIKVESKGFDAIVTNMFDFQFSSKVVDITAKFDERF